MYNILKVQNVFICVLSFIKKLLVKLWIHWLWDHTVQLALKKKRNRKPHTFQTPNSHMGKKKQAEIAIILEVLKD